MGNTGSGLPYEVGESRGRLGGTSWTVHDAQKRSTKEAVSVFRFDKKRSAGGAAAAREKDLADNFFRLSKKLRHPHVLKFEDGLDTDAEYCIVTEPVLSLREVLDEKGQLSPAEIAWGLHCVFQALDFVNEGCKMVHGTVSPDSIFVTRGGDWMLSGFFVSGPMDTAGPGMLFREWGSILENKYKAPERVKNDWAMLNTQSSSPAAIDAWSLACVLYECFNGITQSASEFRNISSLPRCIHSVYKRMLDNDPRKRPGCDRLLKSRGFQELFKNPVCSALEYLEEFQFKSEAEKMSFIRGLSDTLAQFPKRTACYKILPILCSGLTSAVPGPSGSKPVLSPLASASLGPIIQIGKMFDDVDEYRLRVVPSIVLMFSSTDRALRASLLQLMGDFAKNLEPKVVNEKVFPSICTGFGDSAPAIRELTLKSVLPLAPLLNEKNLNEVFLRHVVGLLKDKEAAIRTNTLICLTRMMDHFSEKSRVKILVGTFLQALRDPFVPARTAAVRGLGLSTKYMRNDYNLLAQKMLPGLCTSLVDSVPEIRGVAHRITSEILQILKEWSDTRAEEQKREEEEEEARRQASGRTAQGRVAINTTPASTSDRGEGPTGGLVSSYLSGWAGSMGWGASKGGEMQTAPETSKATASAAVPADVSPATAASSVPPNTQPSNIKSGLSLAAPTSTDEWNGSEAWSDNDDDELFGAPKQEPNIAATTPKPAPKASLNISRAADTDAFFGDFDTSRRNSSKAAAKLGLNSKPKPRSPKPGSAAAGGAASAAESRKALAAQKREEARARIAQRKEARKKATLAVKKADSDVDGWDDF